MQPPIGTEYWALGETERITGGPSSPCFFKGADSGVQAIIPFMAQQAMNDAELKFSLEASLLIDGVTFSNNAYVLIFGFTAREAGPIDDGSYDDLRVNILVQNIKSTHLVPTMPGALAVYDRFPKRTNITIANNIFEFKAVPESSTIDNEDMLTEAYCMMLFELIGGFADGSVLVVEANDIAATVISQQAFEFDETYYQMVIDYRHAESEASGKTTEQGEQTLHGDEYVRSVSIFMFNADVEVARGASIRFVANNIECTLRRILRCRLRKIGTN